MKDKKQLPKSNNSTQKVFYEGLRDGFPIGLAYFAVSFSLGISAAGAGLSAFQGFVASLFCLASAGEYTAFTLIAANATYLEIAIMAFIANARYLLMSCSLSQKFSKETPFFHRFIVSWGITDEIFGISIARPGKLEPAYNYGAMVASAPFWAIGTSLGIIMGSTLPSAIVSALSVSLYGMFLAIIIPPGRTNRIILVLVLISFAASYLSSVLPIIAMVPSGVRIILLTVILSAAAALFYPIKGEDA